MEGCLPRTEEDDKLDAVIINEPYDFVAAVVRASDRCKEGHKFHSCRGPG